MLYIDDDALALTSLTALLQALGYAVDPVSDANTAIEKFTGGDYALVITDMNMPGMNGLRLTEAIKKIRPETPVLLISGLSDLNLREVPTEYRPDRVLEKPLAVKQFAGELQSLLRGDSAL